MKTEVYTIRSMTRNDSKIRDESVVIFKGGKKVHAENRMFEPEAVRQQRVEKLSRLCKIEEGYG